MRALQSGAGSRYRFSQGVAIAKEWVGCFLGPFSSYVADSVDFNRWLPGAFFTLFVPFLGVLGEVGTGKVDLPGILDGCWHGDLPLWMIASIVRLLG